MSGGKSKGKKKRKQIEQIQKLQTEHPFLEEKIRILIENIETMQQALLEMRRDEEELQKQLEERNIAAEQSALAKIEKDLQHRRCRIQAKKIENCRQLLQILEDLDLRVPELAENVPEEQKQTIRNNICALDDARKANNAAAEKLEQESEASERIYRLEHSLAADPLTEKQKKQREKELRKLRSEEFASLEAEQKKQEQDDRNQEQAKFKAYLDEKKEISPLDHSLAEDKNLLRMMNHQLQEELFGPKVPADPKAVIREVIDAVNKQTELQEKDSDELWNIMEAVHVYGQIHATGHEHDFGKKKDLLAEEALAVYAYRHLTALVERMNQRNDEANRSKEEDKVYTDDRYMFAAVNLLNYFECHLNGYLGMLPEVQEDPEALHLEYRGYLNSPALDQKVLKKYAQQMVNDPENKDTRMEVDHTSAPLFPHEPCAQDVLQGGIGDCYFVSVLAEIAQSHPDRIREMMRDNQDGTATVRFFYYKGKEAVPFYVTVEKVMKVGQSKYCEWAETLERALAVSGLCDSLSAIHSREKDGEENPRPVPADINHIYNQIRSGNMQGDKQKYPWLYDEAGNLKKWKPSMNRIEWGYAAFAFKLLLGYNADVDAKVVNVNASKYWEKVDPKEHRSVLLTSAYTSSENAIYKRICALKEKNMLVTASTGTSSKEAHKSVDGLNHNHCYSVLGVNEKTYVVEGKQVTRKFVVVRNPHGTVGRKYVLDPDRHHLNAEADPDRKDGISEIELKDFVRQFEKMTAAEVQPSLEEHNRRICIEEEKILASYADAMKEIGSWLDEKIPYRHNSSQYRALRSVIDEMSTAEESYYGLQNQLDRLRNKLIAYKEHVAGDVQNTAWYRPEKMQAVNVLEHILRAAADGYMTPKAYLLKTKTEELINCLNTTELPAETKGYAQAKEMLQKDPEKARDNLLHSAYLQRWISGKTIMEMDIRTGSLKQQAWEKICKAIANVPEKRTMTQLKDVFDPKTIDEAVAGAEQEKVM